MWSVTMIHLCLCNIAAAEDSIWWISMAYFNDFVYKSSLWPDLGRELCPCSRHWGYGTGGKTHKNGWETQVYSNYTLFLCLTCISRMFFLGLSWWTHKAKLNLSPSVPATGPQKALYWLPRFLLEPVGPQSHIKWLKTLHSLWGPGLSHRARAPWFLPPAPLES